jgi:hypothetical protein
MVQEHAMLRCMDSFGASCTMKAGPEVRHVKTWGSMGTISNDLACSHRLTNSGCSIIPVFSYHLLSQPLHCIKWRDEPRSRIARPSPTGLHHSCRANSAHSRASSFMHHLVMSGLREAL